MRVLSGFGVAVLLAATVVAQQQGPTAFPPGFVDPAPILAAAAKEIGEANLQCVTFSGTGYAGAVGQAFESGVNIDWPRIDSLANYRRTINYATRTIVEEFDRKPGLNPASWKYGLGWQDGTPIQKNLHQTFIVSGDHGWHMDGVGAAPVPMSPEDVSLGQLEIWMNPHGFIKAARLPGANPKAVWRWELGEMGRDGPTTVPDKVHVVSITFGQLSHRRHHQQAEPDPAHPHDGGRAGARRLQLRARVHRSADVRQREVPDRVALAPGLGRQLRLREHHRRAQRVRRQLRRRSSPTTAAPR